MSNEELAAELRKVYLRTPATRGMDSPRWEAVADAAIAALASRESAPDTEREYGWAGDSQASTFYGTQEEAEEYIGSPQRFVRAKAGPWLPVDAVQGDTAPQEPTDEDVTDIEGIPS